MPYTTINVETPETMTAIGIKLKRIGFTMRPEDADRMANGAASDQTALKSSLVWVCTVRSVYPFQYFEFSQYYKTMYKSITSVTKTV